MARHYDGDSDYLEDDLLGGDEAEDTTRAPTQPINFSVPVRRKPTTTATSESTRIVVGIDFGTTYTGVAFARAQTATAALEDIEVIQEWTDKMSNEQKVKSVLSYSTPKSGEAQWGSDISEDAQTIANIKLQLQPQDSRLAELESALSVLQGAANFSFDNLRKIGSNPAYPTKSPTQIITDYLTKICECACRTIQPKELAVSNTPVDMVVTVPVNWSYQATNATFRAVKAAGFNRHNFPTLNDMIVLSEPEAASHFTARELLDRGSKFLKTGDCFVLCDAGGGTVDVVAFQVTADRPQLALRKVSEPESNSCGSTFIDAAFKTWLRDTVLGHARYSQLDPTNNGQRITPSSIETGPMRELMRAFEKEKISFNTETRDIVLDLPYPLNQLNIEGRVNEGELTIYMDEMRNLFNPFINEIISLIEGQIDQLGTNLGRKPKSVLLVGGFGASGYLQGMLADSLGLRNIGLHRPDPDKSWTAVVQGAVVYGIEKARHTDATRMLEINSNYGIGPYDKFKWLLRRGDLVFSNREARVSSDYFWLPPEALDIRKRDLVIRLDLKIYCYPDDDDILPELVEERFGDVKKVGVASCDLFGKVKYFSKVSRVGALKVDFCLTGRNLQSEVSYNDKIVGRCTTLTTVSA